jgi:hypothetical protein
MEGTDLVDIQAHIEVMVAKHVTPPTGDDEELVVSGILIKTPAPRKKNSVNNHQ